MLKNISRGKLMVFSLLLFASFIALGVQNLWLKNDGFNNILASNGNLHVKPEKTEMQLASTYTFTSYTDVDTGQIPVKTNWSVQQKQANGSSAAAPGVFLENCQESEMCILHSGVYPQELVLTAAAGEDKAESHITVNASVPSNPFKDDVPDWAKAVVYYLYRQGIVKGYDDGRFGSADPVTRGQVVLMLYNLMTYYGFDTDLYLKNKNCDIFGDVTNSHYAYQSICFAYNIGWFKDLNVDKQFKPDEPMKRAEVAQIIANIVTEEALHQIFIDFNFDEDVEKMAASWLAGKNFEDIQDFNFDTLDNLPPHVVAIFVVDHIRIMNGSYDYQSGKYYFRPNDSINRAEIAKVIVNLVNYMKQLN